MIINIKNRIPTISGESSIIRDNSDFEVIVHADSEWDSSVITAIVVTESGSAFEPIIVNNGKFTLPTITDNTKTLYVGFTTGNVKTTAPCVINVKQSIKSMSNGNAIPEPSPSIYSLLTEKLNSITQMETKIKGYKTDSFAYAKRAEDAAELAEDYKDSAITSKNAAASSASAASTSKLEAQAYSESANASKVAAAASAAQAATSATTAQGYANDAEEAAEIVAQGNVAVNTNISSLSGELNTVKSSVQNLDSTKANKSETYTKSEVDAIAETKASKSVVYSKTEVDTKIEAAKPAGYETLVGDVSTLKTSVNNMSNNKADKSDTYTKNQVDNMIPDISVKANVSDVYTKTAVDNKLSGKSDVGHTHAVSDISGLQSALDSAGKVRSVNGQTGDVTISIPDISGKADKSEIPDISGKADKSNTYTKTEVDAEVAKAKDVVKIGDTPATDTKLQFVLDNDETECVLIEESDITDIRDDIDDIESKLDNIIAVDKAATSETIVDFDISNNYGYLVEQTEFDALKARVAALETALAALTQN